MTRGKRWLLIEQIAGTMTMPSEYDDPKPATKALAAFYRMRDLYPPTPDCHALLIEIDLETGETKAALDPMVAPG